jgi:hypothetical protein
VSTVIIAAQILSSQVNGSVRISRRAHALAVSVRRRQLVKTGCERLVPAQDRLLFSGRELAELCFAI